jgi:hypothetical protein
MKKDDISLAQWALVDEIREGKWKTLDFPRIAREEFDINGIGDSVLNEGRRAKRASAGMTCC